jgi:protein phosphatase
VLRGRRYYLAHVGDSRIYRLRGGRLEQLSTDHVWEHPELKNVLSRAVGLDAHLSVDYADGELEAGDVFALMSDGVWGQLGDRKIADILQSEADPRTPPRLAMGAEDGGSQDNCTALVLRIDALPADRLRDNIARLPPAPAAAPQARPAARRADRRRPAPRIRRHPALPVRDARGQARVLKTLRPEHDDPRPPPPSPTRNGWPGG